MASYSSHRMRCAVIAISFYLHMFATFGTMQRWWDGDSPEVTSITHPGYLTPYIMFTYVVSLVDMGLFVVACSAVFVDTRDQIFGLSDQTVLAPFPKFSLEMRFLLGLIASAVWQPIFAMEIFALATPVKLLEVLCLASVLHEVNIKSLQSVVGFLMYGLGLSLAAAWGTFQFFSTLMLLFESVGWRDAHGVGGDHVTSCLLILVISAISTFWAYWKVNPIWPLVTIWGLKGVAFTHIPKNVSHIFMVPEDPHFPMESKSITVFGTAVFAISWNWCVMIGSIVMVTLLSRAGRIQVPLRDSSA